MLLRYFLLSSITKFQAHTYIRTYQLTHVYYIQYFAKKVLHLREPSWTAREGSFARNVVTNFKLRAQMGCVIIYYVTSTQIANLLCKSPIRESVCEPVYEPIHAPRVSSWFIHFHALRTYALTLRYIYTYIHASVAKRMSHKLTLEAWIDSWAGLWPGSGTG